MTHGDINKTSHDKVLPIKRYFRSERELAEGKRDGILMAFVVDVMQAIHLPRESLQSLWRTY